jgi:hypothetical protein
MASFTDAAFVARRTRVKLVRVALLIGTMSCGDRGQAKLHLLIVEGHDYVQAGCVENEASYHLSTCAHYEARTAVGRRRQRA